MVLGIPIFKHFRVFFMELWPFENFDILTCQQHISKSVLARDSKFCELIRNDEYMN